MGFSDRTPGSDALNLQFPPGFRAGRHNRGGAGRDGNCCAMQSPLADKGFDNVCSTDVPRWA